MKNIASLYKPFFLVLFAGIFCVQVKAQVRGDQYDNQYKDVSVQHKQANGTLWR